MGRGPVQAGVQLDHVYPEVSPGDSIQVPIRLRSICPLHRRMCFPDLDFQFCPVFPGLRAADNFCCPRHSVGGLTVLELAFLS